MKRIIALLLMCIGVCSAMQSGRIIRGQRKGAGGIFKSDRLGKIKRAVTDENETQDPAALQMIVQKKAVTLQAVQLAEIKRAEENFLFLERSKEIKKLITEMLHARDLRAVYLGLECVELILKEENHFHKNAQNFRQYFERHYVAKCDEQKQQWALAIKEHDALVQQKEQVVQERKQRMHQFKQNRKQEQERLKHEHNATMQKNKKFPRSQQRMQIAHKKKR